MKYDPARVQRASTPTIAATTVHCWRAVISVTHTDRATRAISARGSAAEKMRVAGDERVRARVPDVVNRVATDAAVHLERRARCRVLVEHQAARDESCRRRR